MSLLIFACSVPLTEAVKINGALLCRPRVSADNINDFISALGDAFNTVLQSELGHPQEIAKNGTSQRNTHTTHTRGKTPSDLRPTVTS